jgi:hypothetical protein
MWQDGRWGLERTEVVCLNLKSHEDRVKLIDEAKKGRATQAAGGGHLIYFVG